MLLSLRRVVDPNSLLVIRVTIFDGNLENPGKILEEVPLRPRYSFSRVDFYLEMNLASGRPKIDVIETLKTERTNFEDCLSQAGQSVIQGDGHYAAQTVDIHLDYQAYTEQGAHYYSEVFDNCIKHLANTQLVNLT